MEQWYRHTGLPDHYRIALTENGWTNDSITYDWIHFFDEYTKYRSSRGDYRLLLMDRHGSHLTFEFLQYYEDHRIIPFCFPPHTTHFLRPLDRKPFQVYKHYFRNQNNSTVQWGGSVKEKSDFLRDIHGVRMDTFKQRSIRGAFAEIGIYPFNPDLIVEPLTQAEWDACSDLRCMIVTRLPPPSSSINSPPDTLPKLRRSVNKIRKTIKDLADTGKELAAIGDTLNRRLGHFLRGSLIQAERCAQHEDDISRILRNREHVQTKKRRRWVSRRFSLRWRCESKD